MKHIDRLPTNKDIPQLEDKSVYSAAPRYKSVRRSSARRSWSKIYGATAALAATATVLLLICGVGANGERLCGAMAPSRIAGEVAEFFAGVGFADISGGGGEKLDAEQSSGDIAQNGAQPPKKPDSSTTQATSPSEPSEDIYAFDPSAVPNGHTAIIPMDLSLSDYGDAYINNSTGYSPDTENLMNTPSDGSMWREAQGEEGPLVLIIHTHGTEAYSEEGAISYESDTDNYARSENSEENVVAVGRVVANILNQSGIRAVHCSILHDSGQYRDSYARAEQTLRAYLEKFPSIRLVIDIHRDAVIRSDGETVRAVTQMDGEAMAQLMCVVGSDWGGDSFEGWEGCLSLALKLRSLLNEKCENICRPVYLRSSTYNQELARYSLLVEVGTSGNSLGEAKRSAELLARSIAELVKEM